jgi:AraC family transcriptional regulator, regulatory protein of adaptative response / methylated-DNA-[protein]-cysteine methyltransferase
MNTHALDAYYAALTARDPAFADAFIYAVRTTGVYCRPVCKSRRPLRANVEFFASADDARRAGYRSCKRCCPDEATDGSQTAILAAARIIEQADAIPTLAELGKRVGLSPAHLQRRFKRIIGVSPWQYGDALRTQRLRDHLRDGDAITGAIYETGFGSSSGAYSGASATLGMTPARYRQGAGGAHLTYAIVPSELGYVLVAATERGICSVRLGDAEVALEAGLRAEYPQAMLERADDDLMSATSAIVAYIAGNGDWPTLPLDVRATAFQTRVWDALRRIAPGSTTTYSDLARALGDKDATRAVARACATNPVALLIPCHRVVPKAGGSGGYRWGVARKSALLARERARAS